MNSANERRERMQESPPDANSRAGAPPGGHDLVTIGETMVVFSAPPHSSGTWHWRATPGGAESNVAVGAAANGLRVRWVSRLGDDALGRFVAAELAARGVDVDVVWDHVRPTATMTKVVLDGATERTYYRVGSAAAAMSVDDLARVGPTRMVHVSGITTAISHSGAAVVDAIADRQLGHDVVVSFDVNYRPSLWLDANHAATSLAVVCRRADVVFVGTDEALALWGTEDLDAIAAELLVDDNQELIVKRGPGPVTVVHGGAQTTVATPPTPVVDPTGAGDAFAAGYLSGRLRGLDVEDRIVAGQRSAARVLNALGDVAPR